MGGYKHINKPYKKTKGLYLIFNDIVGILFINRIGYWIFLLEDCGPSRLCELNLFFDNQACHFRKSMSFFHHSLGHKLAIYYSIVPLFSFSLTQVFSFLIHLIFHFLLLRRCYFGYDTY